MSTVGRIRILVPSSKEEAIKFIISPEHHGGNDGFYFQDYDAFERKDGSICYVPEHGFDNAAPVFDDEDGYWYDSKDLNVYTFEDFLRIAGTVSRARILFESVDWQCPETLMEEWVQANIWEDEPVGVQKEGICPICGKPFRYGSLEVEGGEAYYDWTCPHCESQGKEWYKLEFAQNVVSFEGNPETGGNPATEENKNE
jgi:hypothetical protein